MSDKLLKDRFNISADELEHRMQLQEKYHNDPARQAAAILDMALEMVMKKLGVNVEEDIPLQQEQLGIMVMEENREEMAGLNGFFVFVNKQGELVPFAWIGSAQLNSLGECGCEVHWFNDNRMDAVGGVKLI
jgi:hypothetical protein